MRRQYVLGLTCCFLLTSVVHAQNQLPTPAQQPPQVQPPQVNYPPALHQMGDVSKELKLNQDQMNRLNGVTKKIQDQYGAQYAKLNNLNKAERFARLQELNQNYYHDWNKTAGEILNDQQRTRYQQLYHQHAGFNSLNNPAIQKRFNMTPEQVKTLQEYADWNNQQMHNIQVLGATNSTKASQLYNAYWQERQRRFDTFLTPAQQKMWREMAGDPYKFQPTFVQPQPR